MEKEELDCIEQFVKTMEGYGYHFSIEINEGPDMLLPGVSTKVSLVAHKHRDRDKSFWARTVAMSFLPRCNPEKSANIE
jgi:hypothetical protein